MKRPIAAKYQLILLELNVDKVQRSIILPVGGTKTDGKGRYCVHMFDG